MAIIVKHSKVSTIPDDTDTNLVRPSDWNADHTLTGLGTMAEQNANAVAITGGTMSGVTITGYIPTTQKGTANGVATLDAGGKVPVSELPAAVLGALSYQGTWDASTNTPTLTSSVGTKGYYYVVSVAGSTNLNGITDWLVGDWAVYNGSIWQKVDNTDAGGDVVGPASATDNAIVRFDTTTGKLIQNSTVTMDDSGVIANATLTSPKINEILDSNGNEVLGLLTTASATDYVGIKNGIGTGVPLHISSEGSSTNIGLHIQPKGSGLVTISDGTDFNKGIRFRSSSSSASAITLLDAVATAGRVVTLPNATTTLVGRDTTDTLTNKDISGSTNTLSNIGNASLTNSAITINGTSTSLGGSINVGTVTSVTGTAPVVSSGGATPAISMAAATGSVDGYLTSTDWTTFNNKGSGTVTSVAATVPSFLSVAGSPITTSGTLAFTYSGTALPLANGGTGQTTANTAFNALAPSQTSNTGKYLTTNGTDTSWATVSASTDLLENNQTISTNYTVTASKNALAVGPITINTGVSVTVGTGQRWLILN